jgi:transposase
MESTGVYWIPLYELLEAHGFEVLLINPQKVDKRAPARKSDMADCQWLQYLHSLGFLSGSFRPHEAICRRRAIRRQRDNLVRRQTCTVQWMQKELDQMNVQVHRAVTDITGKTGMQIVRAIVDGERDPTVLAQFRDRRCRKSVAEIAEHLTGTWREEHLFNLASALRQYDVLSEEVALYDTKLLEELKALQPAERKDATVPPHPNPIKESVLRRKGDQDLRQELWRSAGTDLTRIDGISPRTAALILTEVGPDLSRFPTEKHFVSWLRLCPNTATSGGKRVRRRRNSMGASRIAQALRLGARPLSRSKSALGAYYRRVARRTDSKVASFAVARKIAIYVFRAIRFGHEYTDIGQQQYESQFEARRLMALAHSAKQLGYVLVPKPTGTD